MSQAAVATVQPAAKPGEMMLLRHGATRKGCRVRKQGVPSRCAGAANFGHPILLREPHGIRLPSAPKTTTGPAPTRTPFAVVSIS